MERRKEGTKEGRKERGKEMMGVWKERKEGKEEMKEGRKKGREGRIEEKKAGRMEMKNEAASTAFYFTFVGPSFFLFSGFTRIPRGFLLNF